MKRKKLISSLLCMAMMLSLAACGTEQEEVKNLSGTAESTQTVEESSKEEVKEEVSEEPVTITVGVFDRGNMTEEYGTCIDNKWVDILKEDALEKLNINLEYVAIPRAEEVTKIQALMAAGEEPDIFHVYDTVRMTQWAQDGLLAELSPYMESEAGQSILEFLGGKEIYGMVDGGLYGIPSLRTNTSFVSCYVRKDLLDAVGVELGEINGHPAMTPSQMKDAMIKIKDAGLCDYPIAMATPDEHREGIVGAFYKNVTDETKMLEGYSWEGGKEAYRFMNECYNAGLINPDFALFNATNFREMTASGQWAFCSANYYSYQNELTALSNAQPDANVVAMELIHEDGTPAHYYMNPANASVALISENCENVDKAIELINWMVNDEEVHMWAHHGIEGEHYEYVDGKIKIIDPEYNAKDRIYVYDLCMPITNDPCGFDLQYTIDVQRESSAGVYSDMAVDCYVDGLVIGISEGKLDKYPLNGVIQAGIDYAAEIAENKANLWIDGIMAPEGKFDEIWDRNYEIFWNEGGSQVAEEKLALYEANK